MDPNTEPKDGLPGWAWIVILLLIVGAMISNGSAESPSSNPCRENTPEATERCLDAILDKR